MEDNYYIDLKAIPLADYAKELEQAELIPSRKILKQDIQQRFECLNRQGIKNLNDILVALKTPQKIKEFAQKSNLPEEYLVILKREIASSQPKPVNLKDFPGIPQDVIQKLEAHSIMNTKQLFGFVQTDSDRQELGIKTKISSNEILELTKLTDVSRIKWVGANFARLLVDSECDTVDKVTNADYTNLYNELMKINEEKQYFRGKFGLNDMKLCVIAAQSVPKAIKY